jgi:hypothetical protein
MIALRNIPINKKEVERLKLLETNNQEEKDLRKRGIAKKPIAPPRKISDSKSGAS